jgi:DNA-directed RNA polymerase subunit H
MHELQPKHVKLKPEEVTSVLDRYNLSVFQLPKISKKDPALPEKCSVGDVIKVERKTEEGVQEYFRVVI